MLINLVLLTVISFVLIHYSFQSTDDVLNDALQRAVGVYVDADKAQQYNLKQTVIVTASNYGHINQLYNMKCFMGRLGMKFLVLSLDYKLFNDLVNNDESIIVYPIADSISIDPMGTNTKLHKQTGYKKLEFLSSLVQQGYNVLYMEVDSAVLNDPFPTIMYEGFDYIHSITQECSANREQALDSPGVHAYAGFFYIVSNDKTKRLLSMAVDRFDVNYGLSAHEFIWKALRDTKGASMQSSCHIDGSNSAKVLNSCALDPCLFNSGLLLTSGDVTQTKSLLSSLKISSPSVIHMGVFPDNEVKPMKMAEYGLWLVEEDATSTPDSFFAKGCTTYESKF